MARAKLKFRLHRTAIVLICLALLVILMQGASYFSLSHQLARSEQVEELAKTLARQVAFSLSPIMDSNNDDVDSQKVDEVLTQLTQSSRILDASVYLIDGTLVADSGEKVKVRDRLALDGKRPGSYFNHQIVEMIPGKNGPSGFLRMTLDTHVLATESKQVDNTTNLLRLMILVALAVGIILARTLLQHRRSRWQQSPYLLTANTPVEEDSSDSEEPISADRPVEKTAAEDKK
ncbi:YtjB family periplasmic protein [Yersinia ruckeri]|uniref:YtjB family periplasmic protein n=1 Tax=Yersinia ruckeri TaxID=29486 RepID=UPI002237D756|nr:YtjB family periplasmic protein [Yersinia ruckeri]MCW6541853.1 YtjB family periplasmic protein [Yersinia ruckeri]MCW6590187.1 YtjB family periplasmic protein [Yersinia ruckeri]UZX92219.1 YtjB family periplasmic protein [Yersinia ruckeri]